MKFSQNEEASCRERVTRDLATLGVPQEQLDEFCRVLMEASVEVDDAGPADAGSLAMVRARRCWVIRTEDLDFMGTTARYLAPIVGGAAAAAVLTGIAITVPVAAAAGAAFAVVVTLGINWRRKGIELDSLAILTLCLIRKHREGVTAEDLSSMLETALEKPFTAKEVEEILGSLEKAKQVGTGNTVAVAFERYGRWFSAA
jgi:hypothetical protein